MTRQCFPPGARERADPGAAGKARFDPAGLAWEKQEGLIPAIVQDASSAKVLMLGYMDREALDRTLSSGLVTFYSRSREQPWLKGETSGNFLELREARADCDGDALLILATPRGPTCHLGSQSCFGDVEEGGVSWLETLADIVRQRSRELPEDSYTARLLKSGRRRIAQKVGEEGVEVALAGASGNAADCASEIADLAYHLTVLMEDVGISWDDVTAILRRRHPGS